MSPKTPLYPLRDVCDLAKAGAVRFSRQAEKDYQELGYNLEQAKDCVACITDDEFRKRLCYNDVCWDDYITSHRCQGTIRPIYVKLRIPSTNDYVYVTSFHTQRPIADD